MEVQIVLICKFSFITLYFNKLNNYMLIIIVFSVANLQVNES